MPKRADSCLFGELDKLSKIARESQLPVLRHGEARLAFPHDSEFLQ